MDKIKLYLIIVSILMIAIVLLQSNKAEPGAQIVSGPGELFKEKKERGIEKTITRITIALAALFFGIAIVAFYI